MNANMNDIRRPGGESPACLTQCSRNAGRLIGIPGLQYENV